MSQRGLKFAALRHFISPTLKNNSEKLRKAQKTLDNPLTLVYTVYVDSDKR